jgi:hypothetical protein
MGLPSSQGDQIGRLFTLGRFFKDDRSSKDFGLIFYLEKSFTHTY